MMPSAHHSFYPSLSMWHNSAFPQVSAPISAPVSASNSQLTPSMFQPSLTPTSTGTASPPVSRSYEETSSTPVGVATSNGSLSPDSHAHYGYPPTPPKEVKAEESYFGSSALSGHTMENYMPSHPLKRPEPGSDTYSLPSPTSSATPTSGTPTSATSSYDMATPFHNGGFCNFSGIKKPASKSKNSNAAAGMFISFYFVFVC